MTGIMGYPGNYVSPHFDVINPNQHLMDTLYWLNGLFVDGTPESLTIEQIQLIKEKLQQTIEKEEEEQRKTTSVSAMYNNPYLSGGPYTYMGCSGNYIPLVAGT